MSKLSEAKTLGGVGSILLLLAILPAFGWVLSIIGAVLVLIAIKYISDTVADPSIFNNMVVAIMLALIGVVVGVVVVAASFLRAVGLGYLEQNLPVSARPTVVTSDLVGLILGAILGLAAVWVLFLVSAYFVRRSYGSMSTKLGVSMFGTAGLLYLIGAALSIVLIGFLIIFVALILNIVAFLSLNDRAPMAVPGAQPPPAPPLPPAS